MKAILLKVILSIFFIAFSASCDDPIKPTETPAPNPALLKYKSLNISTEGMQREFYDSVYSWDNALKKGDWRKDTIGTFSFGIEISSKTFETPESINRGKFRVEGNTLIYSFDTLAISTESKTFRSKNVRITFDSSLTTIMNCTITTADSINGIGTTLDGRTSVQRLHYRVNTGSISNLKKEDGSTFSLNGFDLQNSIKGFDAPSKITDEYPDGSYTERFIKFGNINISEKSKVKIELSE